MPGKSSRMNQPGPYMFEELALAAELRSTGANANSLLAISKYLGDHIDEFSHLAFTLAGCPDDHIVSLLGVVAVSGVEGRHMATRIRSESNVARRADLIHDARSSMVTAALERGRVSRAAVAEDVNKLFRKGG